MSAQDEEPRRHRLRALLLAPIAAVLFVPSYNRIEPVLLGLPFFYAYQLLWIVLSSVVIGVVYRLEHRPTENSG